jgi:hypothetical protein
MHFPPIFRKLRESTLWSQELISESFVEWSDSKTMSNKLLITALRENTSITDIHVKMWEPNFFTDMIDIMQHS